MRVLVVTPRLPCLPCHDAARVAASHLVDHVAGRHTVAVVSGPGGGDTRALVERRFTSRAVGERYEALDARLAPAGAVEAVA